jgi:hypothetical protein
MGKWGNERAISSFPHFLISSVNGSSAERCGTCRRSRCRPCREDRGSTPYGPASASSGPGVSRLSARGPTPGAESQTHGHAHVPRARWTALLGCGWAGAGIEHTPGPESQASPPASSVWPPGLSRRPGHRRSAGRLELPEPQGRPGTGQDQRPRSERFCRMSSQTFQLLQPAERTIHYPTTAVEPAIYTRQPAIPRSPEVGAGDKT